MILHVHHCPTSGAIIGWENSPAPSRYAGYDVTTIDIEGAPDPKLHKIDIATGELVDLMPAERAVINQPTDLELRGMVFNELRVTDEMMLVDRPVADREAWTTYRQALRDLSKGDPRPTAMHMLTAFPERPDGVDPAALLRARLLEV